MPRMSRPTLVSPFARAMVEGLVGEPVVADPDGAAEEVPLTQADVAPYSGPTKAPVLAGPQSTWVPRFLEAVTAGASVKDAVRHAGVGLDKVYKLRKADVDFRREWNQAADVGTKMLEQEATRRAYHGVEKPVFHKGEVCGTVREYSDTLLIFLLKGRKPEVYRDSVREGDTKPTAVNITVVNVDDARREEQQRAKVVDVVPPDVSDAAKVAYHLMPPPEPEVQGR